MVAGAEDWAMEALGDMGIDDQRIDGSFFFGFSSLISSLPLSTIT